MNKWNRRLSALGASLIGRLAVAALLIVLLWAAFSWALASGGVGGGVGHGVGQ